MKGTRAFVAAVLVAVSVSGISLNSTCTGDSEYFDTTLLACADCPPGQVADGTGRGCKCAPGQAKDEATRDLPKFSCIGCPSGYVPSADQYMCQKCPGNVNDNTHQCVCQNYEAIVEMSPDGSYLDNKQCVRCAPDTYQGPYSLNCQACPSSGMNRTQENDYQCQCETTYTASGPLCLLSSTLQPIEGQYPLTQAHQVVYTEHESSTGDGTYTLSVSDTFDYYYLQSANACMNYGTPKDCQALANLCVLQVYNGDTDVCKLYKLLLKGAGEAVNPADPDAGWKKGLPWLYYMNDAKDILKRNAEMTVSFDTNNGDKIGVLDFKMAKYHMDGTFMGYEPLTDQLILCPHSSQETERYREFGTNVQIDCTLNVELYTTLEDTYFYEIFLIDSNGLAKDVPVLIRNIRDENSNEVNSGSDESSWQLVRRFFIYDNISGRVGTDAYANKVTTTVLRYLVFAKLVVALQTDTDEAIYVPYFELEYKSRLTSYISTQDKTASVSFESEYSMNIGNFLQVAMGVLILAHVITLFVCIVRTYVWTKNNPPAISRETYIFWLCGKSLMIFLATWTFIIFWYMFLLCAYWFIFFKMQYHVFVLLPPARDPQSYVPFASIVGLLVFLHLITVFDLIRTQSKTDFFFIDWETPNRVLRPGTDQLKAIAEDARGEPQKQDYYKFSVSAWRSIFVANELNELQVQRYVSVEFTLLFAVFFLQ